MSIKTFFYLLLFILVLSCHSKKNDNKDPTFDEKLNVENIDYNSTRFDTLDKSYGQEYVNFSYQFIQTSRIKRHLSTIGLMIDTTNFEYIKRLSYSYKKAGEHQKAIQLLNLAIDGETDPNEKIAHIGYATWSNLYFYRDYEKTISNIDLLMKKTQNDYGLACHGEPCLLLKGQALYKQKKYEAALEAFSIYENQLLQNELDRMFNTLVVFYKGRCYAEQGDYKNAISYFSYLVEQHEHAEAYYQLANIYHKTNDNSKAYDYIQQSKKALQEGYTFKEPYFERFDKVFLYQIEDLEQKINDKLNL